jgi:uncharacterized membrane protein
VTTSSELRTRARSSLKGNWGRAILFFVLMWLIIGVPDIILSSIDKTVQFAFVLIVTGPIMFGMSAAFLALAGNQRPSVSTLFIGFNRFGTTFLLYVLMMIFIYLWMLLLIIPGIIAALRYSQAYYILRDNPEISALEAIRRSKEMMKGHKGRLFMLYLSFIGWWLLGILTLGIGFLWLCPYVYTAQAHFYLDLSNRSTIFRTNTPPSIER